MITLRGKVCVSPPYIVSRAGGEAAAVAVQLPLWGDDGAGGAGGAGGMLAVEVSLDWFEDFLREMLSGSSDPIRSAAHSPQSGSSPSHPPRQNHPSSPIRSAAALVDSADRLLALSSPDASSPRPAYMQPLSSARWVEATQAVHRFRDGIMPRPCGSRAAEEARSRPDLGSGSTDPRCKGMGEIRAFERCDQIGPLELDDTTCAPALSRWPRRVGMAGADGGCGWRVRMAGADGGCWRLGLTWMSHRRRALIWQVRLIS